MSATYQNMDPAKAERAAELTLKADKVTAISTFVDASGTTPPEGTIVRLASAGKYTPAQGDTAAHAAALLGVTYNDATNPLRPLNGVLPLVRFDSLPVLMAPFYVSAATAGCATCTASLIGLQALGVVTGDIAGSGNAYTATVVAPYQPVSSYGTTKEFLDAQTLELLGCTHADLTDGLFDHFDQVPKVVGTAYGNTTTTYMMPPWLTIQDGSGWATDCLKLSGATGQRAYQANSTLTLVHNADLVHYGHSLNTTKKWRLSARAKFWSEAGSFGSTARQFFGITDDGRNNAIEVGRFPYSSDDPTQLSVVKIIGGVRTLTPLGITSYDSYHDIDILSPATGNVLVNVDGVQVASVALATITADTWLRIYCWNSGSANLWANYDWIYAREQRPA